MHTLFQLIDKVAMWPLAAVRAINPNAQNAVKILATSKKISCFVAAISLNLACQNTIYEAEPKPQTQPPAQRAEPEASPGGSSIKRSRSSETPIPAAAFEVSPSAPGPGQPSDASIESPPQPEVNAVNEPSSRKPQDKNVDPAPQALPSPPEIVVDKSHSFYENGPGNNGSTLKIKLHNQGGRTAYSIMVTLDLLRYDTISRVLKVVPASRYIKAIENDVAAGGGQTLSAAFDSLLIEGEAVWTFLKLCRTYEDQHLNRRLGDCSYLHARHSELDSGRIALNNQTNKGRALQSRLFSDPAVLLLLKTAIQTGRSKTMIYPPLP